MDEAVNAAVNLLHGNLMPPRLLRCKSIRKSCIYKNTFRRPPSYRYNLINNCNKKLGIVFLNYVLINIGNDICVLFCVLFWNHKNLFLYQTFSAFVKVLKIFSDKVRSIKKHEIFRDCSAYFRTMMTSQTTVIVDEWKARQKFQMHFDECVNQGRNDRDNSVRASRLVRHLRAFYCFRVSRKQRNGFRE